MEGSRFLQTTSKYRCSNKSCQDEKDKQTAKRQQLRKDKEVVDAKRAADKFELKQMKQKERTDKLAA